MRSSIYCFCAALCAVFVLPKLAQAQVLPRGSSYQSSTTAPARAGSIQTRSAPVPTESFPMNSPEVIAMPQTLYAMPQAVSAASQPAYAVVPQKQVPTLPNHHDWASLYGQELACRRCNLPQHFPYEAENFSYYFRPYEYNEIAPQQAFQPGLEKNPYDNRFFQAIYDQYPMTKSVPEPIR